MRLTSVKLSGFRRFQDATLRVNAKIVALLGPNEAGKTSILDALTFLNGDDDEFEDTDITRGATPAFDHTVIEARFEIDNDDRAAVPQLLAAPETRWWVIGRTGDSKLTRRFEPPLPDPLVEARNVALGSLEDLEDVCGAHAARAEIIEIREALGAHLSTLREPEPDGAAELLERTTQIAASIRPLPRRVQRAHQKTLRAVQSALDAHAMQSPHAAAARELWNRTPDFLKFDLECRDLRSDYDLSSPTPTPVALANLAGLAELDLQALAQEMKLGRKERVRERLDGANAKLEERVGNRWQQSTLSVVLETDKTTLHVLVRDGGSRYTSIAERSDGLRAFVALVAFLDSAVRLRPPVLLVDELETHLHYDAQADLVRMLTRQDAAQQTIYTTHSVGALPDDMGTALRFVQRRQDDPSRSTIINSFWEADSALSQVFYAMGAATVAATLSHRRVLITEGPTDVILLPALIRAVTGRDDLGYQLAPGLAVKHVDALAALSSEAANVAYVVDGDRGGRAIRAKLRRSGVSDERILILGGENSGLVVEDLVDCRLYLEAVAAQLERSHGQQAWITELDLPPTNRPAALAAACRKRGVDPPSKVGVAYEIAYRSLGAKVVDAHRAPDVKALDGATRRVLDPATNDLS